MSGHELINDWLEARRLAALAVKQEEVMLARATEAQLAPARLVPASHLDVKVGAIVWSHDDDMALFWMLIEEVHDPKDLYKAFTAHDGNRYGLDDLWIEETP